VCKACTLVVVINSPVFMFWQITDEEHQLNHSNIVDTFMSEYGGRVESAEEVFGDESVYTTIVKVECVFVSLFLFTCMHACIREHFVCVHVGISGILSEERSRGSPSGAGKWSHAGFRRGTKQPSHSNVNSTCCRILSQR